eukprot:278687-Pleurochrysis_carterae.AAC.3
MSKSSLTFRRAGAIVAAALFAGFGSDRRCLSLALALLVPSVRRQAPPAVLSARSRKRIARRRARTKRSVKISELMRGSS